MRLLNLDLEKTTFIRNDDNTYTVYQLIGNSGILKLPRVSIELKAEALVDNKTGDFWQWINCNKKPSKISKLFDGIKSRLRKKGGKTVMKCTMCGKDFDMWDEQENFCFDHQIGYGSIHDGDRIVINLCCDCFDKTVAIIAPMCKENPIIEV